MKGSLRMGDTVCPSQGHSSSQRIIGAAAEFHFVCHHNSRFFYVRLPSLCLLGLTVRSHLIRSRLCWLVVFSLLVESCNDPPIQPSPIVVTLSAGIQWSGGLIELRSEQFAEFVLIPRLDSAGAVIDGRWENFSVVIGEDTAHAWRVEPDEISVRVPAVIWGVSGIAGTLTVIERPDRVILSRPILPQGSGNPTNVVVTQF